MIDLLRVSSSALAVCSDIYFNIRVVVSVREKFKLR